MQLTLRPVVGVLGHIHGTTLLLCVIALALGQSFVFAGPLDENIERAIRDARFGNPKIAVSIIDLDTGAELADHRGDAAMVPASTMKLLTTGLALHG